MKKRPENIDIKLKRLDDSVVVPFLSMWRVFLLFFDDKTLTCVQELWPVNHSRLSQYILGSILYKNMTKLTQK